MASTKSAVVEEVELIEVEPLNPADDLDNLDVSKFVEEQTGYYPYWQPESNDGTRQYARFFGTLLSVNADDPDFIRYTFQAAANIPCYRGSKLTGNQEAVIVRKGEFFCVNHYVSMNLERYYGETILVEPKNKRIIKGNDGKPRSVWDWKVRVDEETSMRLKAGRMELAKFAAEAAKQMRAEATAAAIAAKKQPAKMPSTASA